MSSRPLNAPERWHVERACSMLNQWNMATKAVPNTIPNDCNMAAKLVGKEIQNDHRAYRIVYQMASKETGETITNRWSQRSHSNGYHWQRTSHGDREDYRESYCTKPLTQTFSEWHTEASKTIAEMYTELNAKRHVQGLPNDYREVNRYSTNAAYREGYKEVDQERTEAIIRMTFTEKQIF